MEYVTHTIQEYTSMTLHGIPDDFNEFYQEFTMTDSDVIDGIIKNRDTFRRILSIKESVNIAIWICNTRNVYHQSADQHSDINNAICDFKKIQRRICVYLSPLFVFKLESMIDYLEDTQGIHLTTREIDLYNYCACIMNRSSAISSVPDGLYKLLDANKFVVTGKYDSMLYSGYLKRRHAADRQDLEMEILGRYSKYISDNMTNNRVLGAISKKEGVDIYLVKEQRSNHIEKVRLDLDEFRLMHDLANVLAEDNSIEEIIHLSDHLNLF